MKILKSDNADVLLAIFSVISVMFAQVPIFVVAAGESLTKPALVFGATGSAVTLLFCWLAKDWYMVLGSAFAFLSFRFVVGMVTKPDSRYIPLGVVYFFLTALLFLRANRKG
jgi:hypothetical protein